MVSPFFFRTFAAIMIQVTIKDEVLRQAAGEGMDAFVGNINQASAEALQNVSGIGATAAKAVVSYREANGEFKRIEDIMKVSGIKNATFEKIKNFITLRS